MASRYPYTHSSNLRSGPQPRSYGAFPPNDGRHANRPNDNPPPYTHWSPAPGPTPIQRLVIQRPPEIHYYREERPVVTVISCGPLICLAIMVIQAVLLICRSDALATFIDLKSAALRAANERGKLELERGKMRRERELWEKAKEERVPVGAFWEIVWHSPECHAYGKRDYWGVLRNVPPGWTAIDACMNLPVEIQGVTVRRPDRCAFAPGSPNIIGHWLVDWDQPDCKPWFRDFHNAGCTNHGSGIRRIEAQIVGISDKKEQDWRAMCASTPMTWDQITYTSPTHCEQRRFGRKVAMWDVPDESCR